MTRGPYTYGIAGDGGVWISCRGDDKNLWVFVNAVGMDIIRELLAQPTVEEPIPDEEGA